MTDKPVKTIEEVVERIDGASEAFLRWCLEIPYDAVSTHLPPFIGGLRALEDLRDFIHGKLDGDTRRGE